jgi:membrane fusion protein (multidrug efflux system)
MCAPAMSSSNSTTAKRAPIVRELEARVGLLQQQVERATDLLGSRRRLARGFRPGRQRAFERRGSRRRPTRSACRYRITAPIGGQILRLDVDVGEVAQPGEVLFTVGQPTTLEIVAEINEEDIPLIAVGQRALLRADAFPDQVLEATLDSITPKGDSVLKTYRVRLSLPDDTPLLSA